MTTTDKRPPINLNRDWPLLDEDGDAFYWRREATKAAGKVREGLCIVPTCTGVLLDGAWHCGAEACITYICDDLTARDYWLVLLSLVGRPRQRALWPSWLFAGSVGGALVVAAIALAIKANWLFFWVRG